jgi:hypothetical protein
MYATALSAATHANAALFAAASNGSASPKLTTAIDDCGTVVPHRWPGGNPPPPPPVNNLAHFAGATLQMAGDEEGPRCGNEPRKLPGFPPPPPPWVDAINAMLGGR